MSLKSWAVLMAVTLVCACGSEPATPFSIGGGRIDPVAADALRAAAEDARVRAFYEKRGWRPAWTNRAAADLRRALQEAERHGVEPASYLAMMDDEGTDADREVALTAAALAYADALATGAVDPAELHGIFTLERNSPDLVAGLSRALERRELAAWLAGLAPGDAEYATLSQAYLAARREAAEEADARVADGPLLRPGARDPRTPQVAAALDRHGFRAPAAEGDPALYAEGLVEAMRAFQQARGLKPDGVVGPSTVRALNRGAAYRALKLAVNLERRRWLARRPPPTRIDVNTAAAHLTFYRQGQPAWRSRVVVGDPDNQTPALQSSFERLVVNPPWRVPRGIAEEEIFPKGSGYMRRNDMYVDDDGMVVQRPGPEAALGLVKFDMVNPHAIYLHDTPAKALFGEDERHLSHGCVRVERAVDFARMLASVHGVGDRFEAALASGDTRPVALAEPVPVRLLYHTAYVVEGGQVAFTPDVYGRDRRLAAALGLKLDESDGGERRGNGLLGP